MEQGHEELLGVLRGYDDVAGIELLVIAGKERRHRLIRPKFESHVDRKVGQGKSDDLAAIGGGDVQVTPVGRYPQSPRDKVDRRGVSNRLLIHVDYRE